MFVLEGTNEFAYLGSNLVALCSIQYWQTAFTNIPVFNKIQNTLYQALSRIDCLPQVYVCGEGQSTLVNIMSESCSLKYHMLQPHV